MQVVLTWVVKEVARGMPSLPKQLLPFPALFHVPLEASAGTPEEVGSRIDAQMSGLDARWRYSPERLTGIAFAASNVWSRAARRKKEGAARELNNEHAETEGRTADPMEEDEDEASEDEDAALGVQVRVHKTETPEPVSSTSGDGEAHWEVEVRWLVGAESVLFESFCGWLKRAIATNR